MLVGLDLDRRPALVKQSDMLDAGKPVKIPDVVSTFVATLCVDKAGMCASVRVAKTLYGPCSLIILDFEAGPLHSGALERLTSFTQFECRCGNGILAPRGFCCRWFIQWMSRY